MTGLERLERDAGREIAVGLLVVGLAAGTVLGAGSVLLLDYGMLVSDPGTTAALLATDGLTPSRPDSSLRVIQAVGLLLPLFVALLNVVVDPASEFDVDHINASLLMGIISLVVAGGLAVAAGFFSDVAFVLKLSLLCLFVVFTFIGNAAMKLLRVDESGTASNDEAFTERQLSGNDESSAEPEADDESESESPVEASGETPQRNGEDEAPGTASSEERTDDCAENGEQQL